MRYVFLGLTCRLIDVSWHCHNGTKVIWFYCKTNDLVTKLTAAKSFSSGVARCCCPLSAGTNDQGMLRLDMSSSRFPPN